jgi:ABC-type sugar transport system ATPase subunit
VATIALDRVSKIFGGGHAGVTDVSLEIPDGEFVVLVGPSGSGKSTLLRLIAGLEAPTRGRILIDGRDVTGLPPQQRDLAMVFQSYALYPHKTVRDNLAFGLQMRGTPRADIDTRVRSVAESLAIGELLDRRPAQLSGGQRQRVALGRAIVRHPKAFLFDEPLSNLDPALRLDTRTELALLHRRLHATIVYVTHDQEEAMTLGQRVVLLRGGQVEQVGAPMDIYQHPRTLFAARFLGMPPMNVLRGIAGAGPNAVVGIRPHDVELVSPDSADLTGVVDLVQQSGSDVHIHLRLDGETAQRLVVVTREAAPAVGERMGVVLRQDRLHRFPDEGPG